ncbi:hypothetical protein GP486_000455 [Trichoglossum hirsutum]|uniref:SHSP domain-containing protein n=1 Tax=Trichoglossum hirsutum TaxID=265104 RepID=A0A9P8LIJ4_9PEZI|nr:hypothetical protein GP486_000455 [Trichoglossum hirsutum]
MFSPPTIRGEFAPIFRFLDDYDHHRSGRSSSIRAFQPRFDVHENDGGYELHGELPGIRQSDINIEFSDPQTIVISGRSERSFESGTPPAGLIEEGREQPQPSEKSPGQDKEGNAEKKSQPKYWISERSVGEFHRSFSFPTRVDQDAVKASLKDGILSIVVPKAGAARARKITIS